MLRLRQKLEQLVRYPLSKGLPPGVHAIPPTDDKLRCVRINCLRGDERNLAAVPDDELAIRFLHAVAKCRPFGASITEWTAVINMRAWAYALVDGTLDDYPYRRQKCPDKGRRCNDGRECLRHAVQSTIDTKNFYNDKVTAERQLGKILALRDIDIKDYVRTLAHADPLCRRYLAACAEPS